MFIGWVGFLNKFRTTFREDLGVEMMEDEWEKSTEKDFPSPSASMCFKVPFNHDRFTYPRHYGLCGLAWFCTEAEIQKLTASQKKLNSVIIFNNSLNGCDRSF